MILALSFLWMSFIRLRKFPSLPSLLSVFNKHVVGFCQMLLCVYCNDHMAFVLYTINMVCCIDFFLHVQPTLHPWYKSYWTMVYNRFYMFPKFICLYFVEDFFASIFLKHLSVVFFSCDVYFVLVILAS